MYSCSDGIVIGIDTFDTKYIIDMEFGDYIFSYYNLDIIQIALGQKIKKSDEIGQLGKCELTLFIRKENDVVIASDFIKCN